ncbi:MAG: beta-phosphoglucomutase [Thermodesulfobacterium geofontis]|uniref:phosphoglycolate phosphatase n=1 Tax=Thermodesulfobacterium geofontis TaxID=1295609 RepID=A0A2N7QFL9_9BACT|nr:MAG: beta-phosphoglucomutase [Thermodesulfobacterium geofontis]
MNILKLLVFDCDGVLFDSKLANIYFYNYLLKKIGRAPLTPEEIEFIHMHSVNECIEYILRDYPEKLELAKKIQKETSYQFFFKYIVPEEGLFEFLNWAKKYFYLALCTNRTTSTYPLLEYFNLKNYFDFIMTASQVSKNNPLALLTILKYFKVEQKSTLYIGDSKVDKELCEKCNVKLVSYKNPDLRADFYVKNYKVHPLERNKFY